MKSSRKVGRRDEAMMNKKDEEMKKQVIFMYSTVHLLKKDKIRFYYALKGRDGKTGIVKRYQVEQLGRTVLFVEEKYAKEVHDFLNYCKCKYTTKEVFLKE